MFYTLLCLQYKNKPEIKKYQYKDQIEIAPYDQFGSLKVRNNTLQSVLKIKGELNSLRSILTIIGQFSDKLPYDHGHDCTYIYTTVCI